MYRRIFSPKVMVLTSAVAAFGAAAAVGCSRGPTPAPAQQAASHMVKVVSSPAAHAVGVVEWHIVQKGSTWQVTGVGPQKTMVMRIEQALAATGQRTLTATLAAGDRAALGDGGVVQSGALTGALTGALQAARGDLPFLRVSLPGDGVLAAGGKGASAGGARPQDYLSDCLAEAKNAFIECYDQAVDLCEASGGMPEPGDDSCDYGAYATCKPDYDNAVNNCYLSQPPNTCSDPMCQSLYGPNSYCIGSSCSNGGGGNGCTSDSQCPAGYTCQQGGCVQSTICYPQSCEPYECGEFPDGCGGYVYCYDCGGGGGGGGDGDPEYW